MDCYGLFPRFKLNRKLSQDEKNNELIKNQRMELDGKELAPDIAVISINSHFMELVDKYYSSKGVLSFISGGGFIVLAVLSLSIVYSMIFEYGWDNIETSAPYFLFLVPCSGMIFFLYSALRTEWFAWTHYPIRFERKNRLVHFIQLDGTARSVPWDEILFTSGLSYRKEFNKDYYISGHILADDNETVIDTFCLPATSSDRKELERHWEFVRRYMEEGPESVVHAVKECLPIACKREGYQFGLIILISAHSGAPIILFPLIFTLSFIFSIPRYIAMITSKVPVWPESIEEQCAVLENDPYAVDASINSKHPWRDMFRKQPEDE
ncbi:MAG: hypothetical protein P4L95_04420 [Rouxiella aceris]|uniref:DUF6708 domain-containing protein n=1 Tax=Rouxiella aceris TaxID=2703884 RepID=UPI00283F1B21|nr:DUF6708 domain-containing protein [Rouxiella aceris]MDR3431143.1 hypothetical protein [Rouxiella aceris]